MAYNYGHPEHGGMPYPRAPSETSSPSIPGGASEYSEFQPVIMAVDDQSWQSAQRRGRSRSPSPRAFTHDRWAPSQREKRKYASLFKRTDWDNDGFVQGGEAAVLLERSRLDNSVLSVAWEHSDQDRDGLLSFPEFVCLVHLVTCLLRGAALPSLQEGLPLELRSALQQLESPEELVAQREASRSRSRSPSPGPATRSPAPPSPPPLPAWGPPPGDHDAGFPTETLQVEAGADDGFGQWPAGPGGEAEPKPEKKRKGKDKGAKAPPDLGGFSGFADTDGFPPAGVSPREEGAWGLGDHLTMELPFGDAAAPRTPTPQDLFAAPERGRAQEDLGELGAFASHQGFESSLPGRHEDLTEGLSHFESIIAADREVSRQLRREVDDLHEELRQVQEACLQLERQVAKEQGDVEALSGEKGRLERQLRDAKQHLIELRDDRRAVNLESLSLRRDRGHFAEELAFLKRLAQDEEETLEALRRANGFLERSYRDLEGHTELLEQQRRELLIQVTKEREQVRLDERENGEMRNKLERLRRELLAVTSERREANVREHRIREMQTIGQPAFASNGRPKEVLHAEGQGHSWATSLLSSTGSGARRSPAAALLPATPSSDQSSPTGATPYAPPGRSVPWSSALLLNSREGV